MHELRCDTKLHGVIVEDNLIEIACNSRFCGAGAGTLVLHRFELDTGKLLETLQFKNPRKVRR